MLPYILGYYVLCFVLCGVAFRLSPKPQSTIDIAIIVALAPLIVLRSQLKQPRIYFMAAAVIIGIALLSGCGEYDQAVADSAEYCENVDIWRSSHGINGHPAYRGINECGVSGK